MRATVTVHGTVLVKAEDKYLPTDKTWGTGTFALVLTDLRTLHFFIYFLVLYLDSCGIAEEAGYENKDFGK